MDSLRENCSLPETPSSKRSSQDSQPSGLPLARIRFLRFIIGSGALRWAHMDDPSGAAVTRFAVLGTGAQNKVHFDCTIHSRRGERRGEAVRHTE